MSTARTPIQTRFTPANPCPVCEVGTKGCSVTTDDLYLCRGGPARPDEWVSVIPGTDGLGFYHFRRKDSDRTERNGHAQRNGVGPVIPEAPKKDWLAEVKKHAAHLATEHKVALAENLRLPDWTQRAIPLLGWTGCGLKIDSTGEWVGAWTYPLEDGRGTIVGMGKRFPIKVSINGGTPTNKSVAKGGQQGITIPAGWPTSTGPVFAVEGVSDTIAAAALGLAVVARPSNKGGVDELARLLHDLSLDRPIIIVGDRDERDDPSKPSGKDWPGLDGAIETASKLARALNRPVLWALPPEGLKDSREWVQSLQQGAGDTEDWAGWGQTIAGYLVANARTPEAPAPVSDGPEPQDGAAQQEADADPEGAESNESADRVEVELSPDLHAVAAQVLAALVARDAGLFQLAGRLVYIRRGVKPPAYLNRADDAPAVEMVTDDHLAVRVSRVCRFFDIRKDRYGETVRSWKMPPERVVRAVRSIPCSAVRPLTGIITAPTLRSDGSLITAPGYDAATGLCFEAAGCPPIDVPDQPTRDDVAKALDTLLYPYLDFPFAEPCHRAAAVAAVLTLAARFTFSGCVPLFLVDANRAGTGKGLLVDIGIVIVTGSHPASMANTTDDAEMRKRLVSIALAGDPVIKLDNIGEHEHLGTPSLDSALTAGVIGDRILGKNETAKLPLVATWFATGNNVRLAGDMPRRVCHIRLETDLENPEARPDVKERRLLEHVRAHRGRYLSAALTILRGWFVAGRPRRELPTWGSFEGWSDTIRQCVVWAGLPDPYETRTQLLVQSDPMSGVFKALVLNWSYIDPASRGVTAAQIIKAVEQTEIDTYRTEQRDSLKAAILELCPGRGDDLPGSRSLGRKLTAFRGRVADGHRLFGTIDRNGITTWFVKRLEQPTAGFAGLCGVDS